MTPSFWLVEQNCGWISRLKYALFVNWLVKGIGYDRRIHLSLMDEGVCGVKVTLHLLLVMSAVVDNDYANVLGWGFLLTQAMMKDQFANYVVQKVLETCDESQRELLLGRIRVHLHALKKYTYGKHIVARVEKLVAAGG